MAHRKAEGSTRNGRDSNPKYLGIKVNHGDEVSVGEIIVRQRGTTVLPGKNVDIGKDDTIYAMKSGKVSYGTKRKINFDNTISYKKIVHVTVTEVAGAKK
ncbi:MAG: 50S ribosomal protein L27 [Candidatus Taylorbacteria bacterium]|nr:50S ribosomal protein L27 [Candidatus Taylorbacteria bacterium]